MIHFKIATPERVVLEAEVDSLTLPTELGEITILPHHIPLVSNLTAGEIRYKHQGRVNFFAVSGGVIEVSAKVGSASDGKHTTEVVVLADTAEFGNEIDLQRAEVAREAARKLMTEVRGDDQAHAEAAAGLEKNLTRIRVAKKHRTHTHKNLESGIFKE